MMNGSTAAPHRGEPKRNAAPTLNRGWLAGRKQAAAYCGVSTRTLNRWMAQGVLRCRKLSPKLLLFRPQDLDAAIETLAMNAA